jgi:hypothetical protein
MAEQFERMVRVGEIDLETGVFPLTLASEGEASDGHILSIKGGNIPPRMPLLVSHWNEPTSQAGSITEPVKALKDKPPRLRGTGQIEMGGEGPSADIRRDLAYMIDKGHVSGMSIRWRTKKSIPRTNLPSNHPYFVNYDEATGPEKWGLFFEEWDGLEGSIVSLGADPLALIGRAEETEGEVSAFWREQATHVTPPEPIHTEGGPVVGDVTIDRGEADPDAPRTLPVTSFSFGNVGTIQAPSSEAQAAAAAANLREAVEQARALGIAEEEVNEILGVDTPSSPEDEAQAEMIERLDAIDERLDALGSRIEGRETDAPPASTERVDAEPLPAPILPDLSDPATLKALGEVIATRVAASEERLEARVQELIAKHTGKVVT